uniref:Uncharacterized protein n=1 Tax=Gasterosteus aculeatus aculeatus TaxID=481459 RepID=A0AAQ4PJT0_GASAC
IGVEVDPVSGDVGYYNHHLLQVAGKCVCVAERNRDQGSGCHCLGGTYASRPRGLLPGTQTHSHLTHSHSERDKNSLNPLHISKLVFL